MTFEMYTLEREMNARAEGHAEGLAEARNEFVLKVIEVGTPIEYIMKATGWSEEKILQVAENLYKKN